MKLSEVGPELRRLRRQTKPKIQVKHLADEAGISESMVGFIERGDKGAEWDTLVKLAELLGYELRIEMTPRSKETETWKLTREDAAEARAYLAAAPELRAVAQDLLWVLPRLDHLMRDHLMGQISDLKKRLQSSESSSAAGKGGSVRGGKAANQ